MEASNKLVEQVDLFIRKYYKNQMLRGALLFVLLFALSYLSVVSLEYVGRFNSTTRLVLLILFIILNGIIFARFIVFPLSKIFSFGERISRYQAAMIIGQFFPEVSDRLVNTLQLNDDLEKQEGNIELLQASIAQNTTKLSVVPFGTAVNYKENKRYLWYLIPLAVLFVFLGSIIPSFFKDGTERLVNYSKEYAVPAPFDFVLISDNLEVEEGSSVRIEVKVVPKPDGEIPERIYMESNQGRFLMEKSARNVAYFVFPKLKNSVGFRFEANGFESEEFAVSVFGRSSLDHFSAQIEFPAYLNIAPQTIENINDLTVPEGSRVAWSGIGRNTSKITVSFDDTLLFFSDKGFKYDHQFTSPEVVLLSLQNKFTKRVDSVMMSIDVVKDSYPAVTLKETRDSLNKSMRILSGVATDDHGVRSVFFDYVLTRKDGSQTKERKILPGISGTRANVFLKFDVSQLGIELEDKLEYWFTVYDNDGVNGSKASKSAVMVYKAPSRKELEQKRSETKEDSKKELLQMKQQADELKESIERLKMDVLNTKQPSWKEQQQLKQIMDQQQSLQEQLEKMNEKMKNSFVEKESFSEMDEELLEQQEMLEDLLNEVMDEELEKLLKELEELFKEQDKEGMQEVFDELEMKSEDASKQMDRTMEMLKRMDVEESMKSIEKGLEELAKEQEELRKDDEISSLDEVERQKEINKKFDDLRKEMKELFKKNEDLKRPLELENLEKDKNEIKDRLENAEDNLEQGVQKKASEKQKEASKKMEELSSKMNAMMQGAKKQQQEEDIEALRSLLENLLRSSFDQEGNQANMSESSETSPSFRNFGKEQRNIIDNFSMVKDSLEALADRLPKISSFVNKELSVIKSNFNLIPDDIDERRGRDLAIKQQMVMTSMNNLSLFLNESLENMQAQMQGDKPGSGSCDNPGGKGKGSEGEEMQNMKDLLKKQLEDMKKGQNPGGKNPGGKEGVKLPFGNKEAAKMAAQQNAMRKKLEELKEKMNKDGSGNGEVLNDLLNELEEQEEKLVNKEWGIEMVRRQKEILTRLLESEKAMEERGFSEERESNSGKDDNSGNQINFLEYKKLKEEQLELIRSFEPSFSKYYRDRAGEFLNKVSE